MKIFSKITAIVFLLGLSFNSCESPDYETGRTPEVNGLQNVVIKIPDNPAEFTATKKGPYAEGEEITVKVPTTDEEPLDLTRLICTVSLQHNCYVENPIAGETDFTQPLKITVIDALGNRHNNTIKVLPTPPKTKYTKLWERNAAELGLPSRNNTGIAIYGDYLAVQELDGPIYLCDKKTGAKVKTIPAANSFMMKARVDAGGHLVTSRENTYGAGFMVYRYSEEEQAHKLVLDYTASDGCPNELGYNMNLIGDVTSGKAYIYATTFGDMTIYYWQLQDGVLVTPASEPNKLRYGPAGSNWTSAASVQRASLDDDSEHYIAYTKWTGGNNDDAKLKASFDIFTPSMEVTSLNQKNHEYRLLGFYVLDVENDKYLILNDQGIGTWAEGFTYLSVFDITNRAQMELTPDDDGYDNFCLFKGELTTGWIQNYFSWGDVAVYKEATSTGYDIYIAKSVVGYDTDQSRVAMFKMNYYRQ